MMVLKNQSGKQNCEGKRVADWLDGEAKRARGRGSWLPPSSPRWVSLRQLQWQESELRFRDSDGLVSLRQWDGPSSPGAGEERGQGSWRTCASGEKAKTKQGPNSAPGKAWPTHTHTRGLGAARRGWSGGSMPMEMRAFLQVLSVHCPQLMTIDFLAYGDQEGEKVG